MRLVRCIFSSLLHRTSQADPVYVGVSTDVVFEECIFVGGGVTMLNSVNVQAINCHYVDRPSGPTTNVTPTWAVQYSNVSNGVVRGMFFPVPTATPYNYILYLVGAKNCKFRSIGTYAKPIALGNGTPVVVTTATRSTTVLTVPSTAHGLVVNQRILIATISATTLPDPDTGILTTPTLVTVASVPDANLFHRKQCEFGESSERLLQR
jgi:hypothetical protein